MNPVRRAVLMVDPGPGIRSGARGGEEGGGNGEKGQAQAGGSPRTPLLGVEDELRRGRGGPALAGGAGSRARRRLAQPLTPGSWTRRRSTSTSPRDPGSGPGPATCGPGRDPCRAGGGGAAAAAGRARRGDGGRAGGAGARFAGVGAGVPRVGGRARQAARGLHPEGAAAVRVTAPSRRLAVRRVLFSGQPGVSPTLGSPPPAALHRKGAR